MSQATEATEDRFLLAVLNSTPIVDGVPTDTLADLDAARAWLSGAGGAASTRGVGRTGGIGSAGDAGDAGDAGGEAELAHLRRARSVLQGIVRGELPVSAVTPLLRGAVRVPQVGDGISWALRVNPDRELAVRVIMAWDAITKESPGRLRPCANDECRLFLIDRSRANRARWCSMSLCGNRMKARRHYQRTHSADHEGRE